MLIDSSAVRDAGMGEWLAEKPVDNRRDIDKIRAS
jgi:hypothetical protein